MKKRDVRTYARAGNVKRRATSLFEQNEIEAYAIVGTRFENHAGMINERRHTLLESVETDYLRSHLRDFYRGKKFRTFITDVEQGGYATSVFVVVPF